MKTIKFSYILLIGVICFHFFPLKAQQVLQVTPYPLAYTFSGLKAKSGDWWEPDTIYIDRADETGNFLHRKIIFTYNEHNDLVKVEDKAKEDRNEQLVDGEWEDYYQSIRTFDERGNQLTSVEYYTNTQRPYANSTKTYDKKNNLLNELRQKYINNQWVNDLQFNYTYDEQNNLLTEVKQTSIDNEWINSIKDVYAYNIQNSLLTKSSFKFESGFWKNIEKTENKYDSLDNMVISIRLAGNENDWINSERDSLVYATNNKHIETFYQKWINGKWETEIHKTFSYNQDGYLTEEIHNHKTHDRLFSHVYDNNNNLIERTEKYKSNNETEWTSDYIKKFSFDKYGNCITADVKVFNPVLEEWRRPITGFLDLRYNKGACIGSFQYAYYLSASYRKDTSSDTGINPINRPVNEVTISPNPAIDFLNVDYTVNNNRLVLFRIHNLSGTLLYQAEAREKGAGKFRQTIDISFLPKGIYLLKVQIGTEWVSKKFIK